MRKVKRKINVKLITAVLSFALLFAGTLGSSLAWLLAKSEVITNTFTSSDINITLTETTGGNERKFQMVPGYTIDKDPKVTVKKGSEDCYVFVKIEETNNSLPSNGTLPYYLYEVNYAYTDSQDVVQNWKKIDGIPENVYYIKIKDMKNAASDLVLNVLGTGTETITVQSISITYKWGNAQVLTHPAATEFDMTEAGKSGQEPKLTFTAYASQLYASNTGGGTNGTEPQEFTAEAAWSIAKTAQFSTNS
ncbi:MAG: hypothetical protein E7662_02305 [Ruminococcaceae bacterium]|nr:hypothetical protein [Oscillospiraceae bacterium]